MKLGIYSDSGCTQPLTSIDFGNMTHPNQATTLIATFWIRNEGSVWNVIYWNSTLGSVSTEITNTLSNVNYGWYNWNGSSSSPGQVSQTYYMINIPAYATAGTYNWTLNIWGINYY
jgi:hypothetical protein